ncbi:hypothetical protein GCM10009712_41280 [Pseudarthrobacter sulfonivorans]|uniref:hypothetical protein n=1 Tax=Pseudarthrobacter sulfonivorans TaxID=121292 RepID=UPI00168BA31E|nr:hypothetical protein [Pseudarthrobacter sulfonivorans]
MRSISRVSIALAASAVLVGSLALPASADDTVLTVVVPVGQIGISGPLGGTAALTALTPGGDATATIEDVTVIDNRAGVAGWVASVSLEDFVGLTPSNIISAADAAYDTGVAVETGTSTVTSADVSDLSIGGPVQTAAGVVGNNTAIWDATLTVTAPDDALADTYTATLTHSVL